MVTHPDIVPVQQGLTSVSERKSYSKCKRRGHVARMCHSSNIHEVTRDDDPHEDHFELGAIYIPELGTILLDSDVIVVRDDNKTLLNSPGERLPATGSFIRFIEP